MLQRDMGVCKYQDVDAASGKRMMMLASSPEGAETSPVLAGLENPKCHYIAPGGDDYRGLINVTGDGTPCLPWPKGYAGKYHGSGLAKDPDACEDIPSGTRCWQSCSMEQQTNNFCRNPTDADHPFCRTGGTDEDPEFSTCYNVLPCPDTGCTHDAVDGSDYKGEISFTVSGKTCKPWKQDDKWKEAAVQNRWKSSCRNPDGKKLAWCLVDSAASGYEFCNIGRSCEDEDEGAWRLEEAIEQGAPMPFPVEGIYAHYTTAGWEKTAIGQWDDESGNNRHSLQVKGLVAQKFAAGRGADAKVGYLSGSSTASVLFPKETIPSSFTICSVSRFADELSMRRILGAADKEWFHGHNIEAGVAYYGKWVTPEKNSQVKGEDWLVMCGQNGDHPAILANGQDVSAGQSTGEGGAQLAINKDGWNSNWDVVGITVWDRILTAEEVKMASEAYFDFLHDGGAFGISTRGENRNPAFPRSGMYAHYSPKGFSKTVPGQWDDESGFGRNSVKSKGNIALESKAGFGAGETLAYLSGDSEAAIVFGEGSIPLQFTICSLSRYTGDHRNSILNSHHTGAEWFHGHSGGNAGLVYYGLWKTLPYSSLPATDWVVVCSQNMNEGVTLVNGMEVDIEQHAGQPGGDGNLQLAVNSLLANAPNSDWGLHGLTVWDRYLSRAEITAASNAYLDLLESGGTAIRMRS